MKLFFPAIIAVALLTACATDPSAPPLNSERIEARFGSYGVQILYQDSARRVTCLYSVDGDRRRCRTLAIVRFADPAPAELREPLRAIRGGASLGATLAADGWQIDKVNRYLGAYRAPDGHRSPATAFFDSGPREPLALHIYELVAGRGDSRISVATLLEIHDPDYLSVSRLRDIYASLPMDALSNRDLETWQAEILRIPAPAATN